mgnify:CR=1 FL=1
MAQRPIPDTEPRVQRLRNGPYRETGMGPQGLASAGLCVLSKYHMFKNLSEADWVALIAGVIIGILIARCW